MRKTKGMKATISSKYSARARIVLATEDAVGFLRTIPNDSISLILTSPPYNVGKEYEPKLSHAEYVASQLAAMAELVRVLRQDGSICWQVGSYVERGEVLPLDILFYPLFKSFNLILRNRIVWHYRHGLHSKNRFSGRYETILWFTKSERFTFNLDAVRVPPRYPGKRNYKGPHRGEPSSNPKGANPSDFWDAFQGEWEEAVWDFPNVKANHPEKTAHPCQFPIELAERCVLALTHRGETVLDPYAGVGTTLLAALIHKRRAIGIDRNRAYTSIARRRIASLFDGTLRRRVMGTPIYTPSPNHRVARPPDERRS